MFLTMFEEIQNIMHTMHINNVFQTIKKIPKNVITFFFKYNYMFNIHNLNSIFEAWKKLHRLHFNWITRLLPLLSTEFPKPKTSWKTSRFFHNDAKFWRCFWKNIDVNIFDDVRQNAKRRANDTSYDVNRPPLLPDPNLNLIVLARPALKLQKCIKIFRGQELYEFKNFIH